MGMVEALDLHMQKSDCERKKRIVKLKGVFVLFTSQQGSVASRAAVEAQT
jgi:hypothetical protein